MRPGGSGHNSLVGSMGVVRRPSVGLVLALGMAACSLAPPPAVLVIHNRSDAPIALYPEVTIPPCSTSELDEAAIARGKARLSEEFARNSDFVSWVPAGTVQLTAVPPQRIGAPAPLTVIVSGVAQPRFVEGRVSTSELPDCGGQPVGPL